MAQTFSTLSVRTRDQQEAWCEWFRPVFEVIPREPAKGFAAKNTVWNLDGMVVSRVSAPAVRVERTKTALRRNPVDHWVLSYCHHGTTAIHSDRGSLEARAGVPYLWSLGQPSRSERTDTERIQLFLMRDTFRDIAPLLDAACFSTLDTSLGRLLGDFILALEHRLDALSPADLPRLTLAVRAIVAACVAPSAERVAAAGKQLDLGRLERIRQAVRKHLQSPSLGPETLCREVGMSRSNLYRLLEESGGVKRYIQRQRLLEAHATLCNPPSTRSIAALADDLCFADASSFSRAFRNLFGYSPSETRSAAMAGVALPASPPDAAMPDRPSFGALLHGFP